MHLLNVSNVAYKRTVLYTAMYKEVGLHQKWTEQRLGGRREHG